MPRVVILAEAGAGKTEELRLRARTLQNEGKNAFFCRMESIADNERLSQGPLAKGGEGF